MSRDTSERMRSAVSEAFTRRVEAGRALAGDAERVARACYEMAVRFHAARSLGYSAETSMCGPDRRAVGG